MSASIQGKYPITDWVCSVDQVKPGDKITFVSTQPPKREIFAEVIQAIMYNSRPFIKCKDLDTNKIGHVDIYNTITYKIGGNVTSAACTCGAKHTSRPNYHLDFCDVHSDEW